VAFRNFAMLSLLAIGLLTLATQPLTQGPLEA
jgi:hypothetical protein